MVAGHCMMKNALMYLVKELCKGIYNSNPQNVS